MGGKMNNGKAPDYAGYLGKIFVYCIKNTIEEKVYVGSTAQNPETRWRQHKKLLESNKHSIGHLQADWNKLGENAFEFYVLEECELEGNKRWFPEQEWINRFRGDGSKFYNSKNPTIYSTTGR